MQTRGQRSLEEGENTQGCGTWKSRLHTTPLLTACLYSRPGPGGRSSSLNSNGHIPEAMQTSAQIIPAGTQWAAASVSRLMDTLILRPSPESPLKPPHWLHRALTCPRPYVWTLFSVCNLQPSQAHAHRDGLHIFCSTFWEFSSILSFHPSFEFLF